MVKNSLRIYTSGLLFFLPLLAVQAQMVNKGIMVIGDNTRDVITFFDFSNESGSTFVNNDKFHVMKNYKNKGEVGHDNKGTTLFRGGSKQTITGEGATYLYNVVFDNPSEDPSNNAAFELFGDINIEGEADFKDGIVNNVNEKGKVSNRNIIFWENATAKGASDYSYVNGMVEKMGGEFKEFPIGSAKVKQYRYAGISASSNLVTAEYFLEATDPLFPHTKKEEQIVRIDESEYWEVSGSDGLVLTLSWDDDTTPKEFLDNPEGIRIANWNETEGRWKDMGGIVDISGKKVSAPVEGEGIFTLAMVNTVTIADGELEIFNAITPDGDGKNDKFSVQIKGGGTFDKLVVRIYNRWGVKVFESDNYESDDANTFYGYSNGRVVVDRGTLLSRGTYWYVLDYEFTDTKGNKRNGTKVGYLYLASDPNVKSVF